MTISTDFPDRRRAVSRSLAAVSLGLTLLIGLPAEAVLAAGPSQIASVTGTYDCTSSSSQCNTNVYSAPAGARGTMVCWEDGRSAVGSVRWFYFRFDNGKEGFVPANRVAAQTSVNACSDTTTNNSLRPYRRGVAAAKWALSRNGQIAVSSADQARLSSRGGVASNWTQGDWSGDCSGFVFPGNICTRSEILSNCISTDHAIIPACTVLHGNILSSHRSYAL